jgi:mRNA interferase MazF
MPLEFGDVVLVPFPFTDQTASKKRPAVIVSGLAYNQVKPDVVVMAVTSQFRPSPSPGEVWIVQWQAAGLLKPSAIKPVFATLEQRLIIRQLGKLAAADQMADCATLRRIFSTPMQNRSPSHCRGPISATTDRVRRGRGPSRLRPPCRAA